MTQVDNIELESFGLENVKFPGERSSFNQLLVMLKSSINEIITVTSCSRGAITRHVPSMQPRPEHLMGVRVLWASLVLAPRRLRTDPVQGARPRSASRCLYARAGAPWLITAVQQRLDVEVEVTAVMVDFDVASTPCVCYATELFAPAAPSRTSMTTSRASAS